MDDNIKEGFLAAIENNNGYDYVANNYFRFSKEELKDICLELLYAVHEVENGNEIMDEVANELKDRWS